MTASSAAGSARGRNGAPTTSPERSSASAGVQARQALPRDLGQRHAGAGRGMDHELGAAVGRRSRARPRDDRVDPRVQPALALERGHEAPRRRDRRGRIGHAAVGQRERSPRRLVEARGQADDAHALDARAGRPARQHGGGGRRGRGEGARDSGSEARDESGDEEAQAAHQNAALSSARPVCTNGRSTGLRPLPPSTTLTRSRTRRLVSAV